MIEPTAFPGMCTLSSVNLVTVANFNILRLNDFNLFSLLFPYPMSTCFNDIDHLYRLLYSGPGSLHIYLDLRLDQPLSSYKYST